MSQPPLPGDPTVQQSAQPQPPTSAPQRPNTVLVVMLVVVSMSLLFVLLYFLFLRDSSDGAASGVTTTTTTTVPDATTTVPGATTTPVATTVPAAPQATAAPAPPPTGPGQPCGPPGPPGPSPSQNFPVAVNIPAFPTFDSEMQELRAGDTISLLLIDVGTGTDPFLEIYDPCGNFITANDDISPSDLSAALTVVVNDFGFYEIRMTSVGGAPGGQGQLTITVN
jgi:hypothetical protein